ncbi:MAG TPA: hypothetical protein PLO37_19790 [Candidatus Hydrogenedentes bacterium]|nr:hypothetical protein [Candidatus Hydrogenedentota bacterium]HPG69097.1 hypothetical protein [Candidatus Hydrogenedentota bacterium]
MRHLQWKLAVLALLLASGVASAESYAVPKEQLDTKKVYWGTPSGFERAAEIDYQRVIQETPEYDEIKRKKIERGTGKYWILLSQASDRVVRGIAQVGQSTGCDLIVCRGYLSGLEPPIPAEDVTQRLLDSLNGKDAKDKRG